jgi:hypothetical protein
VKTLRKRTYRWYVKPLDAHTNRVLNDAGLEYIGEKKCSEGKKGLFWEAPNHQSIRYLQRSKSEAELKFDVYVQEGNNSLRLWVFPRKKRIQKGGKS